MQTKNADYHSHTMVTPIQAQCKNSNKFTQYSITEVLVQAMPGAYLFMLQQAVSKLTSSKNSEFELLHLLVIYHLYCLCELQED